MSLPGAIDAAEKAIDARAPHRRPRLADAQRIDQGVWRDQSGAGARFEIYLPRVEAEADGSPGPTGLSLAGGERELLVDH